MLFKHLLAWFPLAVIAVCNGVLRASTYGRSIPELAAHQVSTATGILFSGMFVFFLHRLWPLQSAADAWTVGALWLVFTIAFEFGFGHYVAGDSWQHLLNDYKLWEGRVWSLLLFWILVMPRVFHGIL